MNKASKFQQLFVGETAPADPSLGDGWCHSASKILYRWDGAAWVEGSWGFGSKFADVESTTFQSTTSESTWLQCLRLNLTSVPAGKYRIGWFYVWSHDSASNDFLARLQVDDMTNLINPDASDGNAGVHRIEPGDSLDSGNGGTNQRTISSGFAHVTLTEGNHTVDLDVISDVGNEASIHHCRLEAWRVS